ncbi:MAG: nitroreductase family protein [Prevotellaceae bacterium]|nr:nitroreductase family protein [Prevotella sp.]MDD7258522.1 nitroreductase family protein [Prevotellaceae bacterium]MDY6131533.1 nitroreductase family protein [Prevotella sp.]
MNRNFQDAVANRRSYYALKNESPIGDNEIRGIVEHAVKHVPSAFNSQSTRVVVLLGENHRKVWEIVKGKLRKMVPSEAFAATESKINGSFESGYGTILYYEDQDVVKGLQEQFPLYADNFPVWSEHTSAMHQFAIWTALEDAGFGASVQHYNPLIDAEVAKTFGIKPSWKLRAQMPFGVAIGEAGEKTFAPIEERVLFFK